MSNFVKKLYPQKMIEHKIFGLNDQKYLPLGPILNFHVALYETDFIGHHNDKGLKIFSK